MSLHELVHAQKHRGGILAVRVLRLELSLQALSKYAFGMGLLQMVLCTAAFTAFALPVGHGLGSMILEGLFHAPQSLVGIRRVDEAIVIGYALSLSSSAFVLQLLSERGELATRFGSATLGILLFQDIAVVPFLVLLPQVAQMVRPPQLSGAFSCSLLPRRFTCTHIMRFGSVPEWRRRRDELTVGARTSSRERCWLLAGPAGGRALYLETSIRGAPPAPLPAPSSSFF